MKIFSAQSPEHKEFSLIEFSSEMSALPLINTLPKQVKLIDMFSLMNGNFVVLISCNDLKKTYESLRSNPSVLGGYFTNDTNMESLHAFYYLNKPSFSEALMVVETNKLHRVFEVLDKAHGAGVQVLDIKNQRSFATNTVYLTATKEKLLSFKNDISKNLDLELNVIEKVSETLRRYLGGE
jgi:hypothetical protein